MKSPALAARVLRHLLVREPMELDADRYYLAFHAAAPGNDQADAETDYPGYARVEVALDAATWAVTEGSAGDLLAAATGSNLVRIEGPLRTSGDDREIEITHWSLGLARAGAGPVRLRGVLSAPYQIQPNHRPVFEPGDLLIEER